MSGLLWREAISRAWARLSGRRGGFWAGTTLEIMARRKSSLPVGEASSIMDSHRHASFSSTTSSYTDHDVS